MIDQSHKWLLCEILRAHKVKHSGRTLWDHLYGTYTLLKAWGAEPDVCVGGLFHSVYGTNAFKHKCLDATNRAQRGMLREMIGERAERLAYQFCTIDRPRVLVDGSFTGSDRKDLLEIEVANLIEQKAKRTSLQRLLDCPLVAGGARRTLEYVLKEDVLKPGAEQQHA